MKNKSDKWQKHFEKHWQEKFGEPYVPKEMTENDRKFLEAAFEKTFDYDPDDDEVDARYDKEFNDWCDNFLK